MAKQDAECIFCKIVAGEVPSEKVYEDADVLAFLDKYPTSPGHVLVVPKEHHEGLLTVPPAVLARVAAALPKIADAAVKATGAEGFNILQSNERCAGQDIFHIHFHVIPRRSGDGLRLGFRQREPVKDELGRTGAAIRAALK